MDVSVLPGDVSAGDVITLPGGERDVVVKSVRLGHGGFILTFSDGPADDQVVTLTWAIPMSRHGHTAGT